MSRKDAHEEYTGDWKCRDWGLVNNAAYVFFIPSKKIMIRDFRYTKWREKNNIVNIHVSIPKLKQQTISS